MEPVLGIEYTNLVRLTCGLHLAEKKRILELYDFSDQTVIKKCYKFHVFRDNMLS